MKYVCALLGPCPHVQEGMCTQSDEAQKITCEMAIEASECASLAARGMNMQEDDGNDTLVDYVDPIRELIQIFRDRHPDINCQVIFVLDLKKDSECYGINFVEHDEKNIFVNFNVDAPMIETIKILNHELAHMAAGEVSEDVHSEAWKAEFDALNEEFNKMMAKKLGVDEYETGEAYDTEK